MSGSALASLTATYTDSEGEEDMDEHETPDKQEIKDSTQSEPSSPKKYEEIVHSTSAPPTPKRPARLVSYVDDTVVSDDEAQSPSPGKDDMRRLSMETDTDEALHRSDADDVDDGTIPMEPPGKCPKDLQEVVAKYYYRVQNEGLDMNRMIQDKKNFRNPSIYEKLIQFCDINELDTNYPPEIYNPLKYGKESYYDELAKVQKVEMDRREKEKKEKLSKIDFFTGIVKKSESDEEKKRKSKWDQAAPNAALKPTMKQPGLVVQPLTSSITGTKGTVISAFGSLPKKPRL